MRSGSKHLRIASIIQIILGLICILSTYFLIGAGDVTVSGLSAEKALQVLVLTYAGGAFQIIAGIIGLLCANKKSMLTVILGVLLFIPQLIMFLHSKDSIPYIIVNVLVLAIPYYYLHSAVKNLKD